MLATSAAQHGAGRSCRWVMDTRIQRPDHMLLRSILWYLLYLDKILPLLLQLLQWLGSGWAHGKSLGKHFQKTVLTAELVPDSPTVGIQSSFGTAGIFLQQMTWCHHWESYLENSVQCTLWIMVEKEKMQKLSLQHRDTLVQPGSMQ